jgi:hypothetical protein
MSKNVDEFNIIKQLNGETVTIRFKNEKKSEILYGFECNCWYISCLVDESMY